MHTHAKYQNTHVIEDELHFLFECSKYDEDRESCCLKLQLYIVTLEIRSKNKLIWLFNSENIELLKTLCKFSLKHLP